MEITKMSETDLIEALTKLQNKEDEKEQRKNLTEKELKDWLALPLRQKVNDNFFSNQLAITKEILSKNWIIDKDKIEITATEFLNLYLDEKVKNLLEYCEIKGIEKNKEK